jgi:hypothetical protein
MTSVYVNSTQRRILESYIIDYFFSMKRIHLHSKDEFNDNYVKFLLTKFDRLVYHIKICLDQEKTGSSESHSPHSETDTICKTIYDFYTHDENTKVKPEFYFDVVYKLILFTRDITHGLGEQTLTHLMIFIWYKYFPVHACAILNYLPQYNPTLMENSHGSIGSWKDIIHFCEFVKHFVGESCPVIETCVGMLNHQLNLDKTSMENNTGPQSCSFVAKWIPREKSAYGWLFNRCVIQWIRTFQSDYFSSVTQNTQFEKALNKGKMQYRKLISSLCTYIGQNTQFLQCTQQWSKIKMDNISIRTKDLQHNAFLNVQHNGEIRNKHKQNKDRNTCREKSLIYYQQLEQTRNQKVQIQKFNKHHTFHVKKHLGVFLGSIVKNIMDMDVCTGKERTIEELCKDKRMISLLRTWKYAMNQCYGFEHILPVLDLSLFGTTGWWDAMAMAIMISVKSSIQYRIMAYEILPFWIDLQQCTGFIHLQTENEMEYFTSCIAMFRHVLYMGKCHHAGRNLTCAFQKIAQGFQETNTSLNLIHNTICIVFSSFPEGLVQLKQDHKTISSYFHHQDEKCCMPHIVYWNMNATQGSKGHNVAKIDDLSCILSWSIHQCTNDLSCNDTNTHIDNNTDLPPYTLLAGGSSTLLKYLGILTCFEWKHLSSFQILCRILRSCPSLKYCDESSSV